MSTHSSLSSPVKNGTPALENQSASQAAADVRRLEIVSSISGDAFLSNYLSDSSGDEPTWSPEQQSFVESIQGTSSGEEISLYTGACPLLRLLNSVSKEVFDSRGDLNSFALVFRSNHDKQIRNPFSAKSLAPDLVAVWEKPAILQELTAPNSSVPYGPPDPPATWTNVVAFGEAKVSTDGSSQLTNYLRNHLQLCPHQTAVLGFTARSRGYRLFYHDASVIHRSPDSPWTPGPIHAFIRQLYKNPFRDPSMVVLDPNEAIPTWVTKVGPDVFVSDHAKPEPGPGQRRFTAVVAHAVTGVPWFIKDVWRDARRRYFEGLLYEKAHKGQHLPGLMSVEHHGYVLDSAGREIRTTELGPGPARQPTIPRYKMRVVTQDVGKSLNKVTSLRQFLCVIYDVCVVQRNLYRKSRILHRDISESNIMIAPDSVEFRDRCAEGYDEVKYINQVLARDKKAKPLPCCLLIDLGNGADLEAVQGNPEALAERTGTPKFIARSIGIGEPLPFLAHTTNGRTIPKLDGQSLELSQFMGNTKYEDINLAVDEGPRPEYEPDEFQFRHQLFHDAESVFWVTAWILACSARVDYQQEDKWADHFERFVDIMKDHFPSSKKADNRITLNPSLKAWKEILHPDLTSMASMVSRMHEYISPEWAFRDLDPEHVHEALMRLLLIEIVRIDNGDNSDIPLAVNIRSLPSKLPPRSRKSQTSTSLLSVPSQPRGSVSEGSPSPSLETIPTAVSPTLDHPQPARTKKRNNSHLGDQGGRRRSPRFIGPESESVANPMPGPSTASGSSDRDRRTEAQQIDWGSFDCLLKCPSCGTVGCGGGIEHDMGGQIAPPSSTAAA